MLKIIKKIKSLFKKQGISDIATIDQIQVIKGGDIMKDVTEISKKISILTKEGKFEEAKEICRNYENDCNIQSQHIKILLKEKNYIEALEICNSKDFEDLLFIQTEKAKILCELGRVDEAYEVINNPKFKDNAIALNLNLKIKEILDKKLVRDLYTRVYLDNITPAEINNSDISDFNKMVLKMFYHEKRKLPYNLNEIKLAKQNYKEDKEKISALNELYNKFQSKKFIYLNHSLYSKLLGVTLNDEMIEKYNNEKTYEFKPTKKVVIEQIKPAKKIVVKDFKSANNVVIEQLKGTESIRKSKKKQKNKVQSKPIAQVKKEKPVINLENVKIKDVFANEISEIQKYLYVQMNILQTKKSIDIWDRFDILIDKNVTDYNALSRFIQIATIVENNCSYTNIDIDNLNDKKLRYIKK